MARGDNTSLGLMYGLITLFAIVAIVALVLGSLAYSQTNTNSTTSDANTSITFSTGSNGNINNQGGSNPFSGNAFFIGFGEFREISTSPFPWGIINNGPLIAAMTTPVAQNSRIKLMEFSAEADVDGKDSNPSTFTISAQLFQTLPTTPPNNDGDAFVSQSVSDTPSFVVLGNPVDLNFAPDSVNRNYRACRLATVDVPVDSGTSVGIYFTGNLISTLFFLNSITVRATVTFQAV